MRWRCGIHCEEMRGNGRVEDPRITNTNEKGDENMKKNENEWMKLMMLVMEFIQLQNELTKLKIEEIQ